MTEERSQSAAFELFARDLIGSGTSFRFCARGQSMWPTIQDGDTIHVEPISRAPCIGDIVLFLRTGHFTAHRIVRRRGDKYVTRGDASLEIDGVVQQQELIGTVVAKKCAQTGHTIQLNCAGEKLLFMSRKLRWCLSRLLRFLGR